MVWEKLGPVMAAPTVYIVIFNASLMEIDKYYWLNSYLGQIMLKIKFQDTAKFCGELLHLCMKLTHVDRLSKYGYMRILQQVAESNKNSAN